MKKNLIGGFWMWAAPVIGWMAFGIAAFLGESAALLKFALLAIARVLPQALP